MGSIVTGVIRRRSSLRPLADERLISHTAIVGSGTLAAGVLGVAFQVMASHQLRPADYGAVFVVITLITFIGLPASGFTILMAREASRDRAQGSRRASVTLLRRGNRSLLVGGTGLAVLLAITSPLVGTFLSASPVLLLAAAAGIPCGFALPLLLGEFQGEQRFGIFASLAAGQAALKLVAAIGLGLILGPIGVVAGISVATIAAYAIALRIANVNRRDAGQRDWWRPAVRYMAIVLPSTLALSLLLSADVFLVKHYFPAHMAGEYAAVAAIGRAIFWGATGVAAVLFPKVVFRSARGERVSLLVVCSLLLVAIAGVVVFVVLSIASGRLVTAFAGEAYADAASYLPWYAVGMTFLGATAVLIATHQSRGKAGFLVLLLPLAALEPILIAVFHRTVMQVVQVVDVSMTLPAFALAVRYLIEVSGERSATVVDSGLGVPNLQVSR